MEAHEACFPSTKEDRVAVILAGLERDADEVLKEKINLVLEDEQLTEQIRNKD